MERQLRPYQIEGVNNIAAKIGAGLVRILLQLCTGGGKTVMFASICDRYYKKTGKRILILVHRVELLHQAARTLKEWYNIDVQMITRETGAIYDRQVYIGMVETVFRRLSKNAKYLPEIGMVIYDEAHYGAHRKIQQLFSGTIEIGVTATPLSANKKDPLKNYFQDIVTCVDVPELIASGALVQNMTYSVKGVRRDALKMKNGDFDEKYMSDEYSKLKHINNTVAAYRKYSDGKKAIIFNCSVDHSLLVAKAFTDSGYPCRHVDGKTDDADRAAIFRWFKNTPGAILSNVGIAGVGFDEPSIECVIANTSTMSLVSWLQWCGRGGRPWPGKKHFTIIDMGGNEKCHGDWNQQRDWNQLFHHPPKPREKLQPAPVKECPNCEVLIPAQSSVCSFCGWRFPIREAEYDKKDVELHLVTKNIDVATLLAVNASRSSYYTLYRIGDNIGTQVKKHGATVGTVGQALALYTEKAKEWCQLNDKKWNTFHADLIKNHLYKVIKWDQPVVQQGSAGKSLLNIGKIAPLKGVEIVL